jgi:transporter family-2 protein
MLKPVLIALLAGAVLPVQALINGRLSGGLGSPLAAASVSFFVAMIALVAAQLFLRTPLPSIGQAASIPVWIWLGGLLGAVYVTGAIVSVGAIGTTTAICFVIAGQIGAALLVDRFGLLGAASHPLSLAKLCGATLVLAGAVIAVRG